MAPRSQRFLLLLALLIIYAAASSDGIPLSRGFKLFQDVEAHDIQEMMVVGDEGQLSRGEGRRMDLETMDYPGTGANSGHIPKRP